MPSDEVIVQLPVEAWSASEGEQARFELPEGFVVHRKSAVGLCGRSGVGKSLFLRSLIDRSLGWTVGSSGKALLPDRLAYVPQELAFFNECSLARNCESLSGGATFEAVLDAAGEELAGAIRTRRRWSPASLSGGERRLLAVVCALSRGVDCVLFDETFVSMDSRRLAFALQRLQSHLRSGSVGSALVVTHDPAVLAICDQVYELLEVDERRVLRPVSASRSGGGRPVHSTIGARGLSDGSTGRWLAAPPPRFGSLLRAIVGSAMAVVAVAAFLASFRLFGNPGAAMIWPSFGDLVDTVCERWSIIRSEGWWTLRNALLAWLVSITVSCCFWLMSFAWSRVRKLLFMAWVGFQAIPVLIFAPLAAMALNARGWTLEVLVGVFISVFPLGLVGARLLVAVPRDVLRAHLARGWRKQFAVALLYSWGDIVRAVVSCSPLPAIGVIVSEYLLQERGLGALMMRHLTDPKLTAAYTYGLGTVCAAVLLVWLSTAVGTLIVPRDVSPD